MDITRRRLFMTVTAAGAAAMTPKLRAAKGPLKVITTTEDMAALAREVGGDRITVEALGKGYQDSHFVEPKPSFITKVHSADLLISVGLQLEIGWLPPLITQSRNPNVQPGAPGYLEASQFADILEKPAGGVSRAMGDVHPMGNPHFWLDPNNGRAVAEGISGKLAALRPDDAAYFAEPQQRFRRAAGPGREGLGPEDGALSRPQGDHVPPVLAELRQAIRYRSGRICGAQAGHSADSQPHARADRADEIAKYQGDLGGALLRHEGSGLDRPRRGREAIVLLPSVGGVPKVTDYFKLFDYDIDLAASAFQRTEKQRLKRQMDIITFLAAPFHRQLDSDRHPRLSRRARGRARRHLRGPLARPDRRARRFGGDHLRRRSAHRDRLLGQPRLHFPRRVRIRQRAGQAFAHSAGGHHRDLLRGGFGRDHPGDEQSHRRDRAPQGHAGRQSAVCVLARCNQDGSALRRHRAVSLHFPQELSGDLDEPRSGAGERHVGAVLGSCSFTARSASWSPPRWRSPACCWCSVT